VVEALGARRDRVHATACTAGSMCRRLPSIAADTSVVAGGAPGSSTSTTSVWLMSCARPMLTKPSKVLTAQADYTQRRLPARWPALDGSDGLLHGVDRLNERPTSREGSADTVTPRRCRKRLVNLTVRGSISNARSPSPPPPIRATHRPHLDRRPSARAHQSPTTTAVIRRPASAACCRDQSVVRLSSPPRTR
jgi:hypothetical protein